MTFTFRKGRHSITFKRAKNYLKYCPLDEVLTQLHSAFEDDIRAANVATRSTRKSTISVPILSDTFDYEPTVPVHRNHEPTVPVHPNSEPTLPATVHSEPTLRVPTEENNTRTAPTVQEPLTIPLAIPQSLPTSHHLPVTTPLDEAVISRDDDNYKLLKPRLNYRGGKRPFTSRELENIDRCDRLHKSSHYSPAKMKKIILYTPNCDLSAADVDNWADAHWPCDICTESTIRAAPQKSFKPPTNTKSGEMWEADCIFSEFESSSKRKRPGMLFICLVSGMLFYNSMQSRSIQSMRVAGKNFLRFHRRHFPNVAASIIRTDHEAAFEHMVNEIKGCLWVKAPIGDHANHIENVNGYLKRKSLCALRDLAKQGIAVP